MSTATKSYILLLVQFFLNSQKRIRGSIKPCNEWFKKKAGFFLCGKNVAFINSEIKPLGCTPLLRKKDSLKVQMEGRKSINQQLETKGGPSEVALLTNFGIKNKLMSKQNQSTTRQKAHRRSTSSTVCNNIRKPDGNLPRQLLMLSVFIGIPFDGNEFDIVNIDSQNEEEKFDDDLTRDASDNDDINGLADAIVQDLAEEPKLVNVVPDQKNIDQSPVLQPEPVNIDENVDEKMENI
ncbi:2842_t:CDS:2, partial [Funneliformis geosporum]